MKKIAESLLSEIDGFRLFLWMKQMDHIATVWIKYILSLKGYKVGKVICNKKPPPKGY